MDVAVGAMTGQRQQDLSLGALREEARACSKSSSVWWGPLGLGGHSDRQGVTWRVVGIEDSG